ncbi:MAG TPA: hypothetical protein VM241_07085 [Candidatus Thermoplasmatota archaeon]|nr:hypothetical protein [Candidatus Thermoplasmatota archaeon]
MTFRPTVPLAAVALAALCLPAATAFLAFDSTTPAWWGICGPVSTGPPATTPTLPVWGGINDGPDNLVPSNRVMTQDWGATCGLGAGTGNAYASSAQPCPLTAAPTSGPAGLPGAWQEYCGTVGAVLPGATVTCTGTVRAPQATVYDNLIIGFDTNLDGNIEKPLALPLGALPPEPVATDVEAFAPVHTAVLVNGGPPTRVIAYVADVFHAQGSPPYPVPPPPPWLDIVDVTCASNLCPIPFLVPCVV